MVLAHPHNKQVMIDNPQKGVVFKKVKDGMCFSCTAVKNSVRKNH
jgi:hypothetical protein